VELREKSWGEKGKEKTTTEGRKESGHQTDDLYSSKKESIAHHQVQVILGGRAYRAAAGKKGVRLRHCEKEFPPRALHPI